MADLPKYLSPLHHRRLAAVRDGLAQGLTKRQIIALTGINSSQMSGTLLHAFGHSRWPDAIPDELFKLPILTKAPDGQGRSRGIETKPHSHRIEQDRMTGEMIQARVDADQERLKQKRLRWLEIEKDKYKLTKPGRNIYDMIA